MIIDMKIKVVKTNEEIIDYYNSLYDRYQEAEKEYNKQHLNCVNSGWQNTKQRDESLRKYNNAFQHYLAVEKLIDFDIIKQED